MKRILSILLSAIMVIAILPVSVFMVAAEDTTSTLDFSTTDYRDSQDKSKQVWHSTDGVVTFINEKGSGSNVANYSNPVRCYQGSSVTIECTGITKIVFTTTGGAKYNLKNLSAANANETVTLDGTVVTVEFATAVDSYTIASLANQTRFSKIEVTYTTGGSSEPACDHANANEGDCTTDSVCPDCGKTVVYAPGHDYDATGVCTACGEELPVSTTAEVLAGEIGTVVKVVGVVDSFYQAWDESWGNCSPYIVDESGEKLIVFRTTTNVSVGDEVVVIGTITAFNNVNQIAQGSTVTITNAHVCSEFTEGDCTTDSVCVECGKVNTPAPGHNYVDNVCTECGALEHVCSEWTEGSCTEDSVCVECGEVKTPAPGHNYVDGTCTECGAEAPVVLPSVSLDFSDVANRTSFGEEQQVWEANGIVLTNDKAAYNNALGDYHNPVRFYKGTSVTIAYAGMTKIVFYCNNATYATALANSITVGTVTTEDKVVTIVLDAATDSYTIEAMSAQVRVNSIEVYAEASEPQPEPEYIRIDGYQTTDVVNGKYNVRFVAAIGELVEGQKLFGFDITATYTENGAVQTKSWDKTTHTVYSSITANYGTDVVTAEEIGAAYVTAMAITGVPTSAGAVTFVVKPYTVINGETVYGAAVEIVVTPTVAE